MRQNEAGPTEALPSAVIAANIGSVRARIAAAADRAGRDPHAVQLVAVTKTFPIETVVAAWEMGHADFGENRVQEASAKIAALAERSAGAAGAVRPVWHLIGHLQSNKARTALDLFAIIQSIDSVRLAEVLSRHAPNGYPVLVEVNVAGEASKYGFAPSGVAEAVARIRALLCLDVRGLMTVAPAVTDAEDVRPVFRRLAALARDLDLPELSMGMSNDFEVAIEEGATIVRVGSAIFGHRGG